MTFFFAEPDYAKKIAVSAQSLSLLFKHFPKHKDKVVSFCLNDIIFAKEVTITPAEFEMLVEAAPNCRITLGIVFFVFYSDSNMFRYGISRRFYNFLDSIKIKKLPKSIVMNFLKESNIVKTSHDAKFDIKTLDNISIRNLLIAAIDKEGEASLSLLIQLVNFSRNLIDNFSRTVFFSILNFLKKLVQEFDLLIKPIKETCDTLSSILATNSKYITDNEKTIPLFFKLPNELKIKIVSYVYQDKEMSERAAYEIADHQFKLFPL